MKRFQKNYVARVVMGLGLVGATVGTIQAPAAYAASKTVTVQLPAFSTLDPSQWGNQIMVDQGTVLEGLAGYNQKNQVVPKIAKRWTVTNGGKTWTFYLRKDAKWSNGDPVTAQDFYYAWMRLLSPKDTTGATWASVAQYAANANAYHVGAVSANQVGIKAINKYTLRFTESTPHDITGLLPIAGSMPLDPKAVNAHPTNWYLPQYFVSDGPYQVKSFTPNGELQLVRNSKYVGAKGQFNVGNVQQINVVPTSTVPVEDFMGGKADVADITNPADYQYALTHPNLKAQLHVDPQNFIYYLEWDHSVNASPLDKQTVRQAIAMAINKAPIANPVLNGMSGVATGFGPPGWPGLSKEKVLPYNVKKAKQMLAKAGYPNGKNFPTIYVYCQPAPDKTVLIAQAIAQELKQTLNINMKINPTAPTLYNNIIYQGENKGILPGYVIGSAWANWPDPTFLPLQSNQMFFFDGTTGPHSYRQSLSGMYFPTYDPASVKKYGNPDDAKNGVKWSDWLPLQKAVVADNKYLTAYGKKQPKIIQELNKPLPGQGTMDLWKNLVSDWKSAKTSSAKHEAWVTAWKFVGNYSMGNGGDHVGLDGTVYIDQHQPKLDYDVKLWMAELGAMSNQKQEAAMSAKIVNAIMKSGYAVPLVYNKNIYLERSTVTGAQSNPWALINFYQLQYLSVK